MFRDEIITLNIQQEAEAFLHTELTKASSSNRRALIEKFVLAALGSIPWIGGFLSAAAAFKAEEGMRDSNRLEMIVNRFESIGPAVDERIESEEYLQLVRRAFRVWDEASTEEKRQYVGNVLVNSAGTRVCSDDVIRLFLDWLSLYHESHFAVIRQIYANRGITRYEIWDKIYGNFRAKTRRKRICTEC